MHTLGDREVDSYEQGLADYVKVNEADNVSDGRWLFQARQAQRVHAPRVVHERRVGVDV